MIEIPLYQFGRDLGRLTTRLDRLSECFDDHSQRLKNLEAKFWLIVRMMFLLTLWGISWASKLQSEVVSDAVADLVVRFLTGS